MAHAARIEDGVVRQVIVIPDDLGGDESDSAINAYLHGIGLDGDWKRTSYNASIRGKYAGMGDTYDEGLDEFVSPPVIEPDPEP